MSCGKDFGYPNDWAWRLAHILERLDELERRRAPHWMLERYDEEMYLLLAQK